MPPGRVRRIQYVQNNPPRPRTCYIQLNSLGLHSADIICQDPPHFTSQSQTPECPCLGGRPKALLSLGLWSAGVAYPCELGLWTNLCRSREWTDIG